jgi:O-antigen ligase
MALDLFSRNPIWGVGTTESSAYFYGMLSTGVDRQWALGERGGIHNLYLLLLFLYGVPALVLFLLFLGSMLLTWRRLLRNHSGFYLVQFGFTLAYCVLNLTNGLQLSTDLGMLFAIILGAGAFFAGRADILSPDDLILR